MYSKIICGTLTGITAEKITVETDVSFGFPSFHIVGLADTVIKESKERVRAAIVNTGFQFPQERVTVNLSPADRKKEGTHFDLPIAVGILTAGKKIRIEKEYQEDEYAYLGEMTLDGRLVRVKGILPLLIDMRKAGIKKFFIPAENLQEALIVSDIDIFAAKSLAEVTEHISGGKKIELIKGDGRKYMESIKHSYSDELSKIPDFADVEGQERAKRAFQIAAAAMHNILMSGSPGSGKSMMAKRLPGIMPPLSYDEMIELTKIYSVTGFINEDQPLIFSRPFRSPDTKITPAALTGGGYRPRPGEVTLAHLGVLFLDELPEFSKSSLESLRTPMEDEKVSVSRMGGKYIFPSKFLTVAAMNPCPCGFAGDPNRECTCQEYQIERYRAKLSGPFLDRIDLFVHVNSPESIKFFKTGANKSTQELREGVLRAREIQKKRYEYENISYNSQMEQSHIKKYCGLDEVSENLLEQAYKRYSLSIRSSMRILKVARTVADIEGSRDVKPMHIAEAVAYKEPKYVSDKMSGMNKTAV